MQSQITELSPVSVEVNVQIPWNRVEHDLKESFARVGRTAKVKGFRPGKVPAPMVRKLFNSEVRIEVAQKLVEAGLIHAMTQHQFLPVGQPEVIPTPLADGQDFQFSAKLEVRPKIEKVNFESLKVEVASPRVLDAQVNDEILSMRRSAATTRQRDDGALAEASDRVIASYAVSVDGVVNAELGAEDREIDLGDEDLLPEFKTGLLGVKVGEERTIDVTFPATHPNEELAGKKAQLIATISQIQAVELPEENDEFAKECGDYATMADLRNNIHGRIQKLAERRHEAAIKDGLIDALIAANDVMAPPSLVQNEKRDVIYQRMSLAQMMGRQLGPNDFADLEEVAIRRVKAALILGALASQEKIEIEPAALEAKMLEIAERTGKHIAKVRAEHTGEQASALEHQVLEERLFTLLRERANIVAKGE